MKQRIRTAILVIVDIFLLNLSFFVSLLVSFNFTMPKEYISLYFTHIFVYIFIELIVFKFFKLYSSLWRYASIDELIKVAMAVILSNVLISSYLMMVNDMLPKSMYVVIILFDMAFIGGARFSYRISRKLEREHKHSQNEKRVMIVGAGIAGIMVLEEMNSHIELNSRAIAFIDDDGTKKGKLIRDVPVVGNKFDIYSAAINKDIDEIIVAIPSSSKSELKAILEECKKTRCKIKTLPGIYDIIDNKLSISQLRDVQIEDLLGREEIKLDEAVICDYITGKTVLITGGGGSIGSELCRQISNFEPKKLVILDIYENNAYDIQNELLSEHKNLNLNVIIASVRDKSRIDQVIRDINPDIVFHAAAHKHVPLMEANPKEAIKNNVLGTLNLVQAVNKYKIQKFVLISTDKAVNPTNIMGASKRLCEMIVQSINEVSDSDFVAVRFGNVLGSNGSVIPIFKRQIEKGGPITVTDPDIIRYFMTIPEAAQLVIQAGSIAKGGEVFVLDMGEPVKIVDLAKDLIRLSGYEPYEDIDIEFTGLRPGEKLFEELLLDDEGLSATAYEKIFIGKPMYTDYKLILNNIEKLKYTLVSGDDMDIKKLMKTIVITYKEPNEVNLRAVKTIHSEDMKCVVDQI